MPLLITTLKNMEERTYRKHKYSSSSSTSYSTYTVKRPPSSNMLSSDSDCMPMNIIGDNDMIRDYDTAVVRLSVGGTGFIVGEHVIATAAHCVYDTAFIDNTIEIIDENNNIIDSFHAESVHVPVDYFSSNGFIQQDNDYALLYVPSVDLSDYGMFSLGVAKDEYLNNTSNQVIVSGFPQVYPDKYDSNHWGLRFKAIGNIYLRPNYSSRYFYYTTDVAPGDSGGPVYVEEGFFGSDNLWHEYKTAIGISTRQSKDGTHNLGIKITPELLAFYNHNQYLK